MKKNGRVKEKEYEEAIKTTLKQVLLDVDQSRFSSLSIVFGKEDLLKIQVKACCYVLKEDILKNIELEKSSIEVLRLLSDLKNIGILIKNVDKIAKEKMKRKKAQTPATNKKTTRIKKKKIIE